MSTIYLSHEQAMDVARNFAALFRRRAVVYIVPRAGDVWGPAWSWRWADDGFGLR